MADITVRDTSDGRIILRGERRSNDNDLQVFVDGAAIPGRVLSSADVMVMVDPGQSEAARPLIEQPLINISQCIDYLTIGIDDEWTQLVGPMHSAQIQMRSALSLDPAEIEAGVLFVVEFELMPAILEWSQPWTLRSAVDELMHIAENEFSNELDVTIISDQHEAQFVVCRLARVAPNESLAEAWARGARTLANALERVRHRLLKHVNENSLVTSFRFPSAIRSACQQYLVYFGQFLQDLGLNAQTDIKDDAERVLFTVRPANGREALEQVYAALAVYLDLPSNPEFALVARESSDIAVRQLEANVYHFQSQLAVASAILQAKDATIEAIQLSNYQLRTRISSFDTDKAVDNSTKADLVPYVTARKIRITGLEFDLPKLVRDLKRRFGL